MDENLINYVLLMTARGKSPKFIAQNLSSGFEYQGATYEPIEFSSFDAGLATVNSIIQAKGDPSKKKSQDPVQPLTRFQEDQKKEKETQAQEQSAAVDYYTWRQDLQNQSSASAFKSFQSLASSQSQEDSQESPSVQEGYTPASELATVKPKEATSEVRGPQIPTQGLESVNEAKDLGIVEKKTDEQIEAEKDSAAKAMEERATGKIDLKSELISYKNEDDTKSMTDILDEIISSDDLSSFGILDDSERKLIEDRVSTYENDRKAWVDSGAGSEETYDYMNGDQYRSDLEVLDKSNAAEYLREQDLKEYNYQNVLKAVKSFNNGEFAGALVNNDQAVFIAREANKLLNIEGFDDIDFFNIMVDNGIVSLDDDINNDFNERAAIELGYNNSRYNDENIFTLQAFNVDGYGEITGIKEYPDEFNIIGMMDVDYKKAIDVVPEQYKTYESAANEYKSLFNVDLTEENYLELISWWYYRDSAVKALDRKEKAEKMALGLLDEFSKKDSPTDGDLNRFFNESATIIKDINSAVDLLGYGSKVNNIGDVINDVHSREMMRDTAKKMREFKNSDYYKTRVALDQDTILTYTQAQRSIQKFTVETTAGIMGMMNMAQDIAAEIKDTPFSNLISFTPFGMVNGVANLANSYDYDFGLKAAELSQIGAAYSDYNRINVGLTLDESEVGLTEAIERGEWNTFLNSLYVQSMDQMPQIVMAVASGGSSTAMNITGIVQSASSAGSTYNELEVSHPYLSVSERSTAAIAMGLVEFASERFFQGAEKAMRTDWSTIGREIRQSISGVEKATRRSTRVDLFSGADDYFKKKFGLVYEFGEEPATESFSAAFGEITMYKATELNLSREYESLKSDMMNASSKEELESLAGELIRNRREYAENSIDVYSIIDAGIVAFSTSGSQLAVSKSLAYVASGGRLRDQIVLTDKISDVNKKILDAISRGDNEEADKLKAEKTLLSSQLNRLVASDEKLYASMSDQDRSSVYDINIDIAKKRAEAKQLRDEVERSAASSKDQGSSVTAEAAAQIKQAAESRIDEIKTETQALMDKKSGIESKYSNILTQIELDEMSNQDLMVIEEVASKDVNSKDLGVDFNGRTSVEVTSENVNQVIDETIKSGNIISTAFSTAQEIIQGLNNVKKIVAEVTKNNGRVIIYSDANSFLKDTNRRSLARGMHSVNENGQEVIRLYMPALKANTAYHETYHSWSLNNLKDKAVKTIASSLAKAIPSNLVERYEGFIEEYLAGEGIDALKYTKRNGSLDMVALAKDYDVLAEELLAEILSDITNGDLSVEYKKGLITSLKEFVSKYTGIRLNADPTLRDVVDAINIATSNLRSGQEISEDFSFIDGELSSVARQRKKRLRGGKAYDQKGLITVTDKDLSKFKRADVENRAIIQAANQIGLQAMSFNKDSINEVIKQKFEELYDIVAGDLVDNYTLTSLSPKVAEAYMREVDAMGREGYSDKVSINEYMDRVNSNQTYDLRQWAYYLRELSKKNPESRAMAYLLLDAVLTNNYDYISGKYQKRTSTSMRGVTPLSESTMKLLSDLYALRASRDRMIADRNENKNIPSVVESLDKYISNLDSKIESILGEVVTDKNYKEGVLSDYVRIQVQQMNGIAEAYKLKESDGGVWMKFPQTKKGRGDDLDRDAVESLKMVAQRSPWCTKTAAEDHLFGGDFYVFATPDESGNFQPRVAIRMDGDKISEVRGIGVDGGGSSQQLEPSMKTVANDFKDSELRVEGGRKSRSEKADVENKKALDLLEELKDKYGINYYYSTGLDVPDGLDITVTKEDILDIVSKRSDIKDSALRLTYPRRQANLEAVLKVLDYLVKQEGSSSRVLLDKIDKKLLESRYDDIRISEIVSQVEVVFYSPTTPNDTNTIDLSNVKLSGDIKLRFNKVDINFSGLENAQNIEIHGNNNVDLSSLINARNIEIKFTKGNVNLSSLVSAKDLYVRGAELLDMSSFSLESFIDNADFSSIHGDKGLKSIGSIKISRDVFDKMFKGDMPVEFYENIIFHNPGSSSAYSRIEMNIVRAMRSVFGVRPNGEILVDGESYTLRDLLNSERMDEMVDQYRDVLASYDGGNGLAQEIGTGRTVPRRMRRRVFKIGKTVMQGIREKLEENPENYIDSPQVLTEEVDKYKDMSDAEIMDVLKDGPLEQLARSTEDTSILAISELINRAIENNDVAKIEELTELVGKSTTTIARLLRQCAELKSSNHVNMSKTIQKLIEKSGSKLTEEQQRKLKILTAKLMSAQRKLSEKMVEVGTSDSDITKEQTQELERLQQEVSNAEKNMNMFTSGTSKRSFFNILRTLTVGNLLVIKSQAMNVGANVINTLVMIPKDVTSGVIERTIRMMFGMAPPDRAWSAMAYFHALKYARKSALKTAEGAITGRADDGSEWSMTKGLTPISSFVRFVASLNMNEEISSLFGLVSNEAGARAYKELSEARQNIARNEDGKITKKEALLNLMEAVFGAPAETNLRALSLGDNPIRAYAEAVYLYKVAKARGLNTKAEIDKFIQFPPKDVKEAAEKSGKQLTFQDDTRASEFVEMLFEKTPDFFEKNLRLNGNILRWLQTLPMPYRKTPTNITHETLTYFNPYYAGLRLAVAINDKDVKKVSDILAKVLIGQAILGASLKLIALGAITPPLEWRDEEEKNLGYNIPHSSINLEALKRYIESGFDPNEAKPRFKTNKDGDLVPTDNWQKIDKLGLIGAGVLYAASIFGTDEAEKVGPSFILNQFVDIGGNMKGFESTLAQSHLQGIDNVYKAMVGEDKLVDLLKSVSAVGVSAFLPNQIISLDKVFGDQEFVADWKPKANASFSEKLSSALKYVVRQRVTNTEGYPARVGWDGQDIKHTPEEIPAGRFVYNVIDITNTRQPRVNLVENEYYNMKVNKSESAEKLVSDAPRIFSHPAWLRNKKISAESLVEILTPKHIIKDVKNSHYWARRNYPGGSEAFYSDFSFIEDKVFVKHIEEEGLFLETDQIRDLQTMVGTKKKKEAESRILDPKWPSFSEEERYEVLDKLIPNKYDSPIKILGDTYVDESVFLDDATELLRKRAGSPKQINQYSDVTLRFLKYLQQNYEAWKSQQ